MSNKNGKPVKQIMNAKVTLSKDEIHDRAKALATVVVEKAELDEQKKNFNSDIKSKIDTMDAKLNSLSRAIREGYEFQDVEYEVKRDVANKINRYVIKGTDTKIKEVPFSEEDMQTEITDKAGKKSDLKKA